MERERTKRVMDKGRQIDRDVWGMLPRLLQHQRGEPTAPRLRFWSRQAGIAHDTGPPIVREMCELPGVHTPSPHRHHSASSSSL